MNIRLLMNVLLEIKVQEKRWGQQESGKGQILHSAQQLFYLIGPYHLPFLPKLSTLKHFPPPPPLLLPQGSQSTLHPRPVILPPMF